MKKIVLFALMITFINSSEISFSGVSSKFKQTIINDLDKKIVYKGEVYISGENILWEYKTPIIKSVLIKDTQVVVTEPEIYQVTVIKKEEGINLKKMYEQSKRIDENKREVTFDDTPMTLVTKDSAIDTITFLDKLENRVIIEFYQWKNEKVSSKIFNIKIPDDFDIVYR